MNSTTPPRNYDSDEDDIPKGYRQKLEAEADERACRANPYESDEDDCAGGDAYGGGDRVNWIGHRGDGWDRYRSHYDCGVGQRNGDGYRGGALEPAARACECASCGAVRVVCVYVQPTARIICRACGHCAPPKSMKVLPSRPPEFCFSSRDPYPADLTGHQVWKPEEDEAEAAYRYAAEHTDESGRGTCEDCGCEGAVLSCAPGCASAHVTGHYCCTKVVCSAGCRHECRECGRGNWIRLHHTGDTFADAWRCWNCGSENPYQVKMLGDVREECDRRCEHGCYLGKIVAQGEPEPLAPPSDPPSPEPFASPPGSSSPEPRESPVRAPVPTSFLCACGICGSERPIYTSQPPVKILCTVCEQITPARRVAPRFRNFFEE